MYSNYMTNYVETSIAKIDDLDFKTLVSEICQSVNLASAEFKNKTLANLFTAIVTECKMPNLRKILVGRVVNLKVKQLAVGSVVFGVCCELANKKGKPMDDFAEKSVFTVIKQCFKAICPPRPLPKRPSRLQMRHRLKTDLILRGRKSGSY
jgi:hypothetical protein